MSDAFTASQALAIVQRDVDATFKGAVTLKFRRVNSELFVALSDGRFHGGPIPDSAMASPASLLGHVAEAAQDTIMGVLWKVWPVCPFHNTGAHVNTQLTGSTVASFPKQEPSWPYWLCNSSGSSHLLAEVGHLAGGE